MNEEVRQAFKNECVKYLDTFALMNLRPYAREIGVDKPTKKQKDELIAEIVAVLLGEKPPVARATRGAPVKDDFVDPKIVEEIARLQLIYEPSDTLEECEERRIKLLPTLRERLREIQNNPVKITVHDDVPLKEKVFVGQMFTCDGIACLIPLHFKLGESKIIVSVEQIRRYDLRDGDIVECKIYVKNSTACTAEILKVNYVDADALSRVKFDEASVGLPVEKIKYTAMQQTIEGKYVDWLVPMGKGQRSLIIGAPKTGKTHFVQRLVKSLPKVEKDSEVLVLLIDQAPEIVAEYQKVIDSTRLIATTYSDEPEKHVQAAEFLLARAKRLVECGTDVLLVVDGLNALAKAYDETDVSGGKVLPCGLGHSALRYVKKYLASAKRLEKKGSLTIVATLSEKTGAPIDEVLKQELASVANHTIVLSEELSARRIYPSVDFEKSRSDYGASIFTEEERKIELAYRNKVHPYVAPDVVLGALAMSKTHGEFVSCMKNIMEKIKK